MPLIDSPRLKPGDRERWARYAEQDAAIGGSMWLARKVTTAQRHIAAFAALGPCYVAVSWGKDSTALADIALRLDPNMRLARATWPPWDNPECEAVRDAFMVLWPRCHYDEIATAGTASGDHASDFTAIGHAMGLRRICGIRAQESGARRLRLRSFGISSKNTCAPLSRFSLDEIFAYLAMRDLPICAAYAMSLGGAFPREALRVDALLGERGRNYGREQWERSYFPDFYGDAGAT